MATGSKESLVSQTASGHVSPRRSNYTFTCSVSLQLELGWLRQQMPSAYVRPDPTTLHPFILSFFCPTVLTESRRERSSFKRSTSINSDVTDHVNPGVTTPVRGKPVFVFFTRNDVIHAQSTSFLVYWLIVVYLCAACHRCHWYPHFYVCATVKNSTCAYYNNNNQVCKAPECQKTSVAEAVASSCLLDALIASKFQYLFWWTSELELEWGLGRPPSAKLSRPFPKGRLKQF